VIFFYPHQYLRDRQLATIRCWSKNDVLNPEIAEDRNGAQVPRTIAIGNKTSRTWKQVLPLLNLKLRPKAASKDAVVYVWGGLILNGPFIVDIDNPWSLVGYNVPAMSLYRFFIKNYLLSERCIEVRCMSGACRKSLLDLFGAAVYDKAKIHYPVAGIESVKEPPSSIDNSCRFLFIGSQFEIKGGRALLAAYKKAKKIVPRITLTIITHLPISFEEEIKGMSGVNVYSPDFSRNDVFELMGRSDILIHPSYMESFGMTILEAMANGLAIIANDIFAIREMVIDGENGILLDPPISKWDGIKPNENFMKKQQFTDEVRQLDNSVYIDQLSCAIVKMAKNSEALNEMKSNSIKRFDEMKKLHG